MKESEGAASINGGHNNVRIEIIPVMLLGHISDSLTLLLGETRGLGMQHLCPALCSESTSVGNTKVSIPSDIFF